MRPGPTFEEIFAVLAAASAGDTRARVPAPDDPQADDLAARLAVAVNLLLDRHGSRLDGIEAAQRESARLVTERTEQLRQSEAKFSKAFQASPAAISIASLPDGRWLEINDALAKMTGYTREEAIGRTSVELGLVDAAARAKILQAVRDHGTVRDVEIRMHTRTGKAVETLVSVEEVEMNGKACALTIQYDITDLKRAEQSVRRLNQDLQLGQAALETANKELEAFSYSVAHDLRAPLRGIEGFCKLLQKKYPENLDEDGKRYLRYICEAASRMDKLIDDLLALSRVTRSELRRVPIDLSGMVRSVLERLGKGDPGRKAEFAVSEGVEGTGDARLIGIALENLLGNAWKFTAARPVARIEFGAMEQDGSPVYFVRDNGAGFDMAYADKLFGVFQRLHSPTEFDGSGIGLATVQRVIHLHGGRIRGEGKVGEGAAFYFTLAEAPAA